MTVFQSSFNAQGAVALRRRDAMLARIAMLRALEDRAAQASARSSPVFHKRGQLLPRERVALLLDPGAPYLPICALAGFMQDIKDPAASDAGPPQGARASEGLKPAAPNLLEQVWTGDRGEASREPRPARPREPHQVGSVGARSVPGGGVVAGIGFVEGVRCMVMASDSGIEAGAIQAMGLEKILRVQEIALQNKLPFIHLVESAGANLMRYRVEGFVHGGALFRNLARLSAAGIPVLTVQHGSGTAGGAYMPGLSDVVILVRGRSRAFLAGPPLLMAATGEVATEEELGGAEMHAMVSGLGEALAEDDRHAIGMAKEFVARMGWAQEAINSGVKAVLPPRFDASELLGLMDGDLRQPVDMREVMARIVDDSDLLEFKPLYGLSTLCAQAAINGHAVGIISNNGPIDVAGANKATHFIQRCCQLGQPIIYLQNTTGYMVGKDSEQAGMIKHGSKMIQAVTNAHVPQITIQCGASFGAGNYGMCGRAYAPRFLFSWPSAKTAVMGGEQAARTMQIVTEAAMARKGIAVDAAQSRVQFDKIVEMFEAQADAFYTSGLLLDDGVIDPRDTRAVLTQCLAMCAEANARQLRPMQFGVARM